MRNVGANPTSLVGFGQLEGKTEGATRLITLSRFELPLHSWTRLLRAEMGEPRLRSLGGRPRYGPTNTKPRRRCADGARDFELPLLGSNQDPPDPEAKLR